MKRLTLCTLEEEPAVAEIFSSFAVGLLRHCGVEVTSLTFSTLAEASAAMPSGPTLWLVDGRLKEGDTHAFCKALGPDNVYVRITGDPASIPSDASGAGVVGKPLDKLLGAIVLAAAASLLFKKN